VDAGVRGGARPCGADDRDQAVCALHIKCSSVSVWRAAGHWTLELRASSGVGRPDQGAEVIYRDYMSVVCLVYASIITRPVMVLAVQSLRRHMSAVTTAHRVTAKRALRNLQGTGDVGIIFGVGSRLKAPGWWDSAIRTMPATWTRGDQSLAISSCSTAVQCAGRAGYSLL
jgi:hypothetical protein